LLEQLKSRPNDPELLANIGNHYYDSKDYAKAIDYYEKSLNLAPGNVDVRTDLGTAIWYAGDPDRAIREYGKALKDKPDYPQTLFNMGVVKWQGKHDGKAALELWEKLLATSPNYPERQKVEAMMQQVRAEMK
jgi:tetratricopeptide (TPR) repeat protein